jgi:hypothetical protein
MILNLKIRKSILIAPKFFQILVVDTVAIWNILNFQQMENFFQKSTCISISSSRPGRGYGDEHWRAPD